MVMPVGMPGLSVMIQSLQVGIPVVPVVMPAVILVRLVVSAVFFLFWPAQPTSIGMKRPSTATNIPGN